MNDHLLRASSVSDTAIREFQVKKKRTGSRREENRRAVLFPEMVRLQPEPKTLPASITSTASASPKVKLVTTCKAKTIFSIRSTRQTSSL